MAPKTRIPDSLASQSGWKSVSFKIGRRTGKRSSRNTLARTSKAAAEHLPKKKKIENIFINVLFTNEKNRHNDTL